jgi:dienelactone hydrolase
VTASDRIVHEGPGLDDHQRVRADQFAEMGYVAFALDYHGGGQLILDRDDMSTRLAALSANPDRIRTLAIAGLDVLLSEPTVDETKVAALGYCFGGTVALELARTGADIKAVVGFHPGLSSPRPEDSRNIKGKVLMCVGNDDPLIPEEQRRAFEEEMTAAGVDWQMHIYGGVVHSFTHPWAQRAGIPYIRYDQRADKRSWKAMLDLLDEVFA